MFGLQSGSGGDKNKKPTEFLYDIEVEMKDPKKAKDNKDRVASRLQKLKELQRGGGADKEEFELINTLILGYEAIVKVLTRIKIK